MRQARIFALSCTIAYIVSSLIFASYSWIRSEELGLVYLIFMVGFGILINGLVFLVAWLAIVSWERKRKRER